MIRSSAEKPAHSLDLRVEFAMERAIARRAARDVADIDHERAIPLCQVAPTDDSIAKQ